MSVDRKETENSMYTSLGFSLLPSTTFVTAKAQTLAVFRKDF